MALRIETRNQRGLKVEHDSYLGGVPSDDSSLSRSFDREWARAVMKEAASLQAERARASGKNALVRMEILRLKFQEGLPIREIATKLALDATHVHRQYAVARREFREALFDTVKFHHPGTMAEIERECAELLTLLS